MNDVVKSWIFVAIQAVLLVILVVFTDGANNTVGPMKIVGLGIQIIGILILIISLYDLRQSLTALPLPKENGTMQIHGLYRFVRHPMYVGVLTLSMGIALSHNTVLAYVALIGLAVLFNYKAHYEESLLAKKYPGYAKYAKRTPRFIPRLVRK